MAAATYRRVGDGTLLREGAVYVVMARYKDEVVDPFVRFGPATFDECAAYAQRNDSPDNNETYYVAEVQS